MTAANAEIIDHGQVVIALAIAAVITAIGLEIAALRSVRCELRYDDKRSRFV